jgi:hypothetical protein
MVIDLRSAAGVPGFSGRFFLKMNLGGRIRTLDIAAAQAALATLSEAPIMLNVET